MHCLYCKKRLGLFASKKRQFCSEVHEVAYHDEQSGLAMRRVMDPLFTTPIKPPPVRTNGEIAPSTDDLSTPVRGLEAPEPEQGDFCLDPQLPKPAAPDLAATDAPLEVELFSWSVQFPSISGGVLAFALDSETESEAAAEIVAEANGTVDSDPAFPEDRAPSANVEADPIDLAPVELVPVEVAHLDAPVDLESFAEPELAGEIATNANKTIAFDLSAEDAHGSRTAHFDEPFAVEPATGLLHLELKGGAGSIAPPRDSEPKLAGDIAATANETSALDLAQTESSRLARSGTPLEVESPAGSVRLPSSSAGIVATARDSEPELAGQIAATAKETLAFELADAHTESGRVADFGTPLAVESPAGSVRLPSSGAGIIANAPNSELELAGEIASNAKETIAFGLPEDAGTRCSEALLEIEAFAGLVSLPASSATTIGFAPALPPELARLIAFTLDVAGAQTPVSHATHSQEPLAVESPTGPVRLPLIGRGVRGFTPAFAIELAGEIEFAFGDHFGHDGADTQSEPTAHLEAPIEITFSAGPALLPLGSRSVSGFAPILELAGGIELAYDQLASDPVGLDQNRVDFAAPIEIELSARRVCFPSSIGTVIGFDPDSAREADGDPMAEVNNAIASLGLHSTLEPIQLVAIADSGSPHHFASHDPSPLTCGSAAALTGLRAGPIRTESPALRTNLTQLVRWVGVGSPSLKPALIPQECLPLAAERAPTPNSVFDSPRLSERYPLAELAIPSASVEGPAELLDTLWSTPGYQPSEREPGIAGRLPEADFLDVRTPVRMYQPVILGLPFCAEPAFVSATALEISTASFQRESRLEQFRWPEALPVLPAASFGTFFQVPFAGTEEAAIEVQSPEALPESQYLHSREPLAIGSDLRIPAPAGSPSWGILPQASSHAEPSSLACATPVEISLSHPVEFSLPRALPSLTLSSAEIFGVSFAYADAAAIAPRELPCAGLECHEEPQQEPIPPVVPLELPVPGCTAFCAHNVGGLAQSPYRADAVAFSAARPFAISSQSEDLQCLEPRPVLPEASWRETAGALSFSMRFAGVAKSKSRTAVPLNGSTSHPMPRQEPVSHILPLQAPVSNGTGVDLALAVTTACLEPHRAGLTGRTSRQDPREFPTKLYSPGMNVERSVRTPTRICRTVIVSSRVWSASTRAGMHPADLEFRREEIRAIEPWVQSPTAPPHANGLAPLPAFARITPVVQNHLCRQFRALGSMEVQKFRAAAHLRVREPELRSSAAGELPATSTQLAWRGIGIATEIRLGGTPVPLRPALQTPCVR